MYWLFCAVFDIGEKQYQKNVLPSVFTYVFKNISLLISDCKIIIKVLPLIKEPKY